MKTCSFCEYETPSRELNKTEDGLVCDSCMESHELIKNPDVEISPARLQKAGDMFKTFHSREPKASGAFAPRLYIPSSMPFAGESVFVAYSSDKWGDGMQQYIHHHDCRCKHEREDHDDEGEGPCNKLLCNCRMFASNVSFFLAGGKGPKEKVPEYVLAALHQGGCRSDGCSCAAPLTRLGRCLEFSYINLNGDVVEKKTGKSFELFCIPSGKALLIIENRSKLVAMVWGGKLNVKDVGIVG